MPLTLRKPVCFVLIPFGMKIHPDSGASVDFDAIYEGTIRPALHTAGMDPLRLDQDVAGLKESSVQQRVLEAEFALADVTTRDPAILFLLGSRAERKPGATLVLAARGSETQLAALSGIRVLVYSLDEGNCLGSRESLRLRRALAAALSEMRDSTLAPGRQETIDPVARERSFHGAAIAQAIEAAGDKRDLPELKRVQAELQQLHPDSPLLLNLFQAYGNIGDWEALLGLVPALPPEMQKMARVRRQAGLALSRLGRHDQAVAALSALLNEQGPDAETLGALGSIYNDLWFDSRDPAALDSAIEWYRKGFEANRKDAYPGIYAVRLLEIRGDPESLRIKEGLLPFVTAAVQDQMKHSRLPNYWDHATLLELAVLAGDENQARLCAEAARGSGPESWQTEATADILDLIRDARARRGVQHPWLDRILADLHASVPAA
jgi:tetratricopeptide (TPR) repeat protein